MNSRTLADADGEFSDWIEIANLGSGAADLEGWSLTDDAEDLRKWRFPKVTLPRGGLLVVFASGKNRSNPAAQLHTNFKLSGAGEFLALVDPYGTVVSGFAPAYPPQFADISYGHPQEGEGAVFAGAGASARAFVPADGSLGTSWYATSFDDSGWTAGKSAVGYGPGYGDVVGLDIESLLRGRGTSAYVRIPFTLSDPSPYDYLVLRMRYDDGYIAWLNGRLLARVNAPGSGTPRWDWKASSEHGGAVVGSLAQDFDGGGAAYVLTAHGAATAPIVLSGGPTGRYLQLLKDYTGSLTNTIGFERTFGAANRIAIEFDYRMSAEAGYTGGERADGFGVALLDTSVYGASGPGPSGGGVVWERPSFPSAFSVGFDIYDGTKTENTVSLNWGGAQVGAVRVSQFDLNGGRFNRVRVEIASSLSGSRVTVAITPDSLGSPGTTVYPFRDFEIPLMRPFDHRLAFGGRTGGEFVGLDLDNIRVDYERSAPADAFEEIDISSARSSLLAGKNVLAIQGLNVQADDPSFLVLPELVGYIAGDLDLGAERFFPEPTPGLPNGRGYPGVATPPAVSRPSGAYASAFTVALSSEVPGAAIRYTTDRRDPTETSPLYAGPIQISKTTVLRARTFVPGFFPSEPAERVFLMLDPAVAAFSSDLPVAVIETFGLGVGTNAYTRVWSAFVETIDGRAWLSDPAFYAGMGGIALRGSSSLGFPKKMYKFETWDRNGDDFDVALLGLPADSDWVLNGPYSDKTLMRNHLAYAWSNDLGRYAPRTRFFELFLSTDGTSVKSSDYQGVYVLIEKIKRGEERVDVKELLPSDTAEPRIRGGYILKKDRLDPGDQGFRTNSGQVLGFVDPKESEIAPEQKAWIVNYLNEFEAALYGPNFRDPELGYAKYIDADSFVDHHILVEMTKNIDGFRLSTFFYKDRWKKLEAGPIWDYNLSLGNADYLGGWLTDGWYCDQLSDSDYPWYRRLFQDPDFSQRYFDRWVAFRKGPLATSTMLSFVDATAAYLEESQVRNFQKWPVLGVELWPNWFVGPTYASEIAFMKDWIVGRMAWIDARVPAPPVFSQDGGAIPPGGLDLSLSAPAGRIYYTLDGSDPRAPGGGIAPGAAHVGAGDEVRFVPAEGPVQLRWIVPTAALAGTGWTAVGFDDRAWAGGTGGTGVGYERGSGYETYIDWDAGASMYNVNPSVYVRVTFTVADPGALNYLALRVMYDDGFVAFLNGVQVASGNATLPVDWNSSASGVRDETAAVTFEEHNISERRSLLEPGTNVLALQGLNATVNSSDLLLRAELVGARPSEDAFVRIAGATEVSARTWISGKWSGLSRAAFVLDVPLELRITEVHFHPGPVEPGVDLDREEFEFVEIMNAGASPADLLGVRLSGGIEFDFSRGAVRRLDPGAYLVVARNLDAFASRYPEAAGLVAGEYSGHLSNDGESLKLVDGRGVTIQEFRYEDGWYREADGRGRSLHIVDPYAPLERWSRIEAWLPSVLDGGSPGGPEPADPNQGLQRIGDFDQDATLDLSDAVALLSYLFRGTRALPCPGGLEGPEGNLRVLDGNGDGSADIADAVHLLLYLFGGGAAGELGPECVPVRGCPSACLNP